MTTESLENTEKEYEISLKELILKSGRWFRFLLSKWKVIFLMGVVGAGIGFLYAKQKVPIYTATTTFVLEDGSSNNLSNLGGLASMVGINVDGGGGGGIFQGDNIIELYKSRAMIEKALLTEVDYKNGKKLLIDQYIQFNDLKKNWAKQPALFKLRFEPNNGQFKNEDRLRDSVIGQIVADINTNFLYVGKPDKKLSIIRTEVKAKDEFFAKAFNEQIVKTVNDFYIQTKTKKSIENVAILQRKTDSVNAIMSGAIFRAAAVSDATPNLNPTRQVQRVAPIQRSQISVETNKAVLGLLLQNLEMAKYAQTKEAPLIQIIDTPVYPLQKNKLSKLKALIIGGFLFGFLTVLILLIKKGFKSIMA